MKRILIVEDNEDSLCLFETLLGKSGYEVVSAGNGVEALEKLRKNNIDMIVSDILMPGMDGFEFCRECKKDDSLKRIPFVFYTATYTEKRDEEFAMSLGADKFIVKPCEIIELLRILKDVIEAAPVASRISIMDEEIYLAEYSKHLVSKLEKKVLDLEEEIKKRKQTEEKLKKSKDDLARAQKIAHLGHWDWDIIDNTKIWSDEQLRIFGYETGEIILTHDHFEKALHPDDHERVVLAIKNALEDNVPYEIEYRIIRPDGTERSILAQGEVFRDASGKPVRMLGTVLDITERKRAEYLLNIRESQQREISEIGKFALTSETELTELMDRIVYCIAKTLDVEYCKILELLPDGKKLLLRAGVGWKEGYVGKATVGTEKESQSGYTLLSTSPVIVNNLRTETRFNGPKLLHDHGVISGMSIIIYGMDVPYGILGAHTKKKRVFTKDDVSFVQSIANILAEAIKRKQAEGLLREQKKALEQKNIALSEILGQLEIEKKQIKDNVIANAENLLLPIIQKLRLKGESRKYVQLLRKNIQELTSSFGARLTEKRANLTTREIEICNMIKNGLTNKEISRLLNISLGTTEKHRNNIRTKLHIVNKDINLSSFLNTL